MKYKTHVIISSCYSKEKYFYLVQGIEYPNLITEGDTIEEAIKMCIDAWSLLCVVYEDKKIQIKESSNNLDINKILSKTDYQEYGITKENSITVEIESEDTNEYRKECDKQEEDIIVREKEIIFNKKKITGFEIAGRVIRSLREIKNEVNSIKFTSKCISGQFATFDRYVDYTDNCSSEETIKKYKIKMKSDITNMRNSIVKLLDMLDTLESTIDSSYEYTNKEEE